MSRTTLKVPKYRRHSVRDIGLVVIGGKRRYLPGKYNSEESRAAYRKAIAEWQVQRVPGVPAVGSGDTGDLTVIELIAAYMRHVQSHYVDKAGKQTSEQHCIRAALRSVRDLYSRTAAAEFGPLALKACRQHMVDAGMARDTVNRNVHRVRRMFRWAASEELLPVTVYQSLVTLSPLQRGRTSAPDAAPIQPVDDAVVEKTLPHLPVVVADMVRLQRLTGARPGEVCMCRPCDVDTSGEIWLYVPSQHKTERHGKSRVIMVGPKGQDVLRPYLIRDREAFCFSPADSEQKRLADRHAKRMTPLNAGNAPGTHVKARPKRTPGDRYTDASYRRAVKRACRAAGVEAWAPNRLRHTAGTEIRRRFGLEAAQVTLGHATANMTQIYAEKDMQKAAEIAKAVG